MVMRTSVGLLSLLLLLSCTSEDRARGTSPPRAQSARAPTPSPTPPEFEKLYLPESDLFEKKRPARDGDWLDRFPEPGQSFLRYQSQNPVRPTKKRRTIVLQPLGSFDGKNAALLETLRLGLAIFFALPVELQKPIALPPDHRRTRNENGRSWAQWATPYLLDEYLAPRVPEHAVIYVGVTMQDLYPDPRWNYVFGEASLEDRVGVYSLVRFFPEFWREPASDTAQKKGLARSMAVLAHETGHAFGLEHCTEYECVMNGSNSLEELDRQFAELCPVCLRKLAWNIGFDPVKRYRDLGKFYHAHEVEPLASWIDRRLEQIER
jgi:archaemetzincin